MTNESLTSPRPAVMPSTAAPATGFEDASSAFRELFVLDLSPRFAAQWRDDLQGWDAVPNGPLLPKLLAYLVVVTLLAGLAGFMLGGWPMAATWAVLMHAPAAAITASFLVLYGLMFERPSADAIHTDAAGVIVGGRRWAWGEITAVHGGPEILVSQTPRRTSRRPGLVLETADGPFGWQVEPRANDLQALAERLDAIRLQRTHTPPEEKRAVEQLGPTSQPR